ncbi:MAG: lipoyl(octanoyl) transferase LipB [Deltaproteobacteria bacterium]|nr:lipoyl(octanoyl) transferase LipB [Deltaproteobacteria bacterium]
MPPEPHRPLQVERLGRVPYGPMLALQEARHAEIVNGAAADTLFLLEHQPVVTLGKNSGADHLLVSREALAARGVELFVASRGGDVTFHGPGQVVGYPVIRLGDGEQDVKRYVTHLEEIMIATAAEYGVTATRVDGLRGIFVGQNKIGAVGVRVAKWVTLHGFALNVAREVPGFELIVPCGLHGRGVTSIGREAGFEPPIAEVMDHLARHAASVLTRRGVDCTPTTLPSSPLSVAAAKPPEVSA